MPRRNAAEDVPYTMARSPKERRGGRSLHDATKPKERRGGRSLQIDVFLQRFAGCRRDQQYAQE